MDFYRSPSCKQGLFCDAFDETSERMWENHDIIIVGDSTKNFTSKNRIQKTLIDNGFKQIIYKYTKLTDNSETLIVINNRNNHEMKYKYLNINKPD